MNELQPLPSSARYWYRFEDTIELGSCDGCNRTGPEDRLCLDCCVSEGMVIGACYGCNNDGPIWENCHWCLQGRYVSADYGVCECDWYGPVGAECTNCEDGVFMERTPSVVSSDGYDSAISQVIEVLWPIDDDFDSESESTADMMAINMESDRRLEEIARRNARLARISDGPVGGRTRSKTR